MATNAARYRMVAGRNVKLLEFGLRRAQGPDGGLSASKYSYIGGFDGTSNVLAGKLYNIPVRGTHAHAYITSFTGISELKTRVLQHKVTGQQEDLLDRAISHRDSLSDVLSVSPDESSEGELAAMVSFAIAFPDGFMALVDTYDVKSYISGQQQSVNNVSSNGNGNINNDVNTLKKPTKRRNDQIEILSTIETNNHDDNNTKDVISNDEMIHEEIKVNGEKDINKTNMTNDRNLLKCVGESFRSGLLNFCAVALALNDLGYRAVGVRIDSGDLAYLSCLARETFEKIAHHFGIEWFKSLTIVASNDINEETILSLNDQGHKIDCFGIGTHLVTCQRQPALGCVYKLVEINGHARIKLSQDMEKVTMPGHKNAYRLYSADGHALIDLLQKQDESPPQVGQKVLCRHPFQESKRSYCTPSAVVPLYKVFWKNGNLCQPVASLDEIREQVQSSLRTLRPDHKRILNPTPYKVAVSDNLYNFLHDLWLQNAPIGELA